MEFEPEEMENTKRLNNDIVDFTIKRARALGLSPPLAVTSLTCALGVMLLSGTEGDEVRLEEALKVVDKHLRWYVTYLMKETGKYTFGNHGNISEH
jgi:hypothetical protein